jgi:hypothetical protein
MGCDCGRSDTQASRDLFTAFHTLRPDLSCSPVLVNWVNLRLIPTLGAYWLLALEKEDEKALF